MTRCTVDCWLAIGSEMKTLFRLIDVLCQTIAELEYCVYDCVCCS